MAKKTHRHIKSHNVRALEKTRQSNKNYVANSNLESEISQALNRSTIPSSNSATFYSRIFLSLILINLFATTYADVTQKSKPGTDTEKKQKPDTDPSKNSQADNQAFESNPSANNTLTISNTNSTIKGENKTDSSCPILLSHPGTNHTMSFKDLINEIPLDTFKSYGGSIYKSILSTPNTAVCLELILQRGFYSPSEIWSLDDRNLPLYEHSLAVNRPDLAEVIYKHHPPVLNGSPNFHHTPMIVAVSSNANDSVKWLLDHDVRADILSQGLLATNQAVAQGNHKMVNMLAQKKVNFNAQDKDGRNAVQWAILSPHSDEEILKTVVAAGGSPHIKNNAGQDAYATAEFFTTEKKQRVIEILNSYKIQITYPQIPALPAKALLGTSVVAVGLFYLLKKRQKQILFRDTLTIILEEYDNAIKKQAREIIKDIKRSMGVPDSAASNYWLAQNINNVLMITIAGLSNSVTAEDIGEIIDQINAANEHLQILFNDDTLIFTGNPDIAQFRTLHEMKSYLEECTREIISGLRSLSVALKEKERARLAAAHTGSEIESLSTDLVPPAPTVTTAIPPVSLPSAIVVSPVPTQAEKQKEKRIKERIVPVPEEKTPQQKIQEAIEKSKRDKKMQKRKHRREAQKPTGFEAQLPGPIQQAVTPAERAVIPSIPGLSHHKITDEITAVGSLFAAIATFTAHADTDGLRQAVNAHIEHNREDFRLVIRELPSDKTLAMYVQDILNEKERADEILIAGAMRLLNRPIVIIDPAGNIINYESIWQRPSAEEPIFIYYNGQSHYDAFSVKPGWNGNQILQALMTQQPAQEMAISEDQKIQLQAEDNYSLIVQFIEILKANPANKAVLFAHSWFPVDEFIELITKATTEELRDILLLPDSQQLILLEEQGNWSCLILDGAKNKIVYINLEGKPVSEDLRTALESKFPSLNIEENYINYLPTFHRVKGIAPPPFSKSQNGWLLYIIQQYLIQGYFVTPDQLTPQMEVITTTEPAAPEHRKITPKLPPSPVAGFGIFSQPKEGFIFHLVYAHFNNIKKLISPAPTESDLTATNALTYHLFRLFHMLSESRTVGVNMQQYANIMRNGIIHNYYFLSFGKLLKLAQLFIQLFNTEEITVDQLQQKMVNPTLDVRKQLEKEKLYLKFKGQSGAESILTRSIENRKSDIRTKLEILENLCDWSNLTAEQLISDAKRLAAAKMLIAVIGEAYKNLIRKTEYGAAGAASAPPINIALWSKSLSLYRMARDQICHHKSHQELTPEQILSIGRRATAIKEVLFPAAASAPARWVVPAQPFVPRQHPV